MFAGLDDRELSAVAAVGRSQSLIPGEYLFLLGDNAERLYVVSRGTMELCFPLSIDGAIKDVPLESMSPGDILGWSSFVQPFRFTLSARAVEDAEVVGFSRSDLAGVFETTPRIGYVFTRGLCEIIGHRLLNLQARWARGVQRALTGALGSAGVQSSSASEPP